MRTRNAVTLYLAAQATAVLAWWAALLSRPDLISYFHSDATSAAAILDLWLADLTLVAGGSAVAAVLVARDSQSRMPALWILIGAVLYATLTTFGASLRSGGGWLAVAFMTPAAIMTVACVIFENLRSANGP